MRGVLLLLLLAGCPKATVPPTSSLEQRLASRDGSPDCATLPSDGLARELLHAAEHAVSPVVAMRAADCLVQRFPSEQVDTLRRWVTDPDTAGLARVVMQHLDAMPDGVARTLTDAAASGPHAALLAQDPATAP